MRFLSALVLGLQLVAAQQPFTLEDVESQIDEFLQLNETEAEAGTLTERFISGCDIACAFLDFTLPHQVSCPNEPAYTYGLSQFWSAQQSSTRPTCRFTPSSAAQVSLAVLTSRVTQCKFAVKSGGHAAFAGASNIGNGLTIDLVNLNQISVSADKKETSMGTGLVWFDVYSFLEPQGLTVIGGRVSAIGVGGLTLGGGLSFFTSRYGWACDNVNKYEIVLADGSIRHVTYNSQYSDLFWALRGGGNNFGIVTRMWLATYPLTDLWAGVQTFMYTPATASAINNAFYHFAINSPSNPDAQTILAYAYVQSLDTYVVASHLQHAKPIANPPIFENFTAVQGAVADSLRIVNLPDLTVEFNNSNPGGFRQTYWTYTVGNSASLMDDMVDIFIDEVNKVKDVANFIPSVVYQPINGLHYTRMSNNGGNPLGLAGTNKPLDIVNIAISWSNAADDTRVLAAARNMVNRSVAKAKTLGLDHPFLYQNYAAAEQKVFPSYGATNHAKLKSISSKYDPSQVFQRLQPGYFKL